MLKRWMNKRTWERFRQGTRGAISILLICLMLPFISVAAILVETGRYQSVVRGLDQSVGSSAYSALSDYDDYLLDRFGLLAVSQKMPQVNEELTKVVRQYLDKQNTTDMRSVDVNSVKVDGVYPLSDPMVLKQQIQHSAAVMAPTKLTSEILDLEGLIKKLEESIKFLHIIEQFSAGIELLQKEAELLENLDNAKKQMKQVQKDEKTYDGAFYAWQGAVQSLIDHLNTPRPAEESEDTESDTENTEDTTEETDQGMTAAEWDATLASLQRSAESARSEYQSAVTTLYGSLDTLQKQVTSTLDANAAFGTALIDFETATFKALIKEDVGEDASEELKTFADNSIATLEAIGSAAGGVEKALGDATKGFSVDRLRAAVESLLNIKNAVATYDTYSVSATDAPPTSAGYHYADMEDLSDPDELDKLLEDAQKQAEEKGSLDMLLSFVSIFNSLFNSETLFDAELNVRLDKNYYNTNFGGLPSERLRPANYSNPFTTQDQIRSLDYLNEMDPNYNADDPYGLYAGSIEGKMDKVVQSITDWKTDIQNLKDAKWFIPKFKAALEAGKGIIEIVVSIADLFITVLKNIWTFLYGRVLTFSYMAYSVPNRTNYTSGQSLSGYKFGAISRPAPQTGTNVPLVGELVAAASGGDVNYSFRGAELEYIIWGNEYELVNQTYVFLMVYLLRLVLALPAVTTNPEVKTLTEAVSAVPYVGPVLGVLLFVVIALTEPFLDTYILVNGDDVSVIKDTVYLTPSGLPELVEKMVSMKLNEDTKQDIIKKASKVYKVEYKEPKKTEEKKDKDKPLIDVDKYKEGLLEFDYTQHCLFLMLLFGSEEKYLNRLADLIQCESTMRNHQDEATTSQHLRGEYTHFNLDEAYTTLRIQVDANLNQVLPMVNLSEDGIRSTTRVLYRGY